MFMREQCISAYAAADLGLRESVPLSCVRVRVINARTRIGIYERGPAGVFLPLLITATARGVLSHYYVIAK